MNSSIDHLKFTLQVSSHEQQFTQSFQKTYKKEDDIKQLIHQILLLLNQTVIEPNDLNLLKKYYCLVHYIFKIHHNLMVDFISELKDFFLDNNFILTALKQRNHIILNKLISEESELLGLILCYPDKTNRNAFYYCISYNHLNLIKYFLKSWKKFGIAISPNLFEEAYAEIKIRNVSITFDMEMLIQEELINSHFFVSKPVNVTKSKLCDNAHKRISLTIQLIDILLNKYEYMNIDENFLFISKSIAKNIFILKGFLKNSYTRIPWEEMEFYLIRFIQFYSRRDPIHLIICFELNTKELFEYLKIFKELLRIEMDILNSISKKRISLLPKLEREEVKNEICKSNPELNSLYESFNFLRNITSLFKIYEYIQIAKTIDVKTEEGKLVIKRTIQVMGELIKNTIETPKMSQSFRVFLESAMSEQMINLIISLRDIYAHMGKTSKFELNNKDESDLYKQLQEDIKKIGIVICKLIQNSQITAMCQIIDKMATSETIEDLIDLRQMLLLIGNGSINAISFENTNIDLENLSKLSKHFNETIKMKTEFEKFTINELENLTNNFINASTNMKSSFENIHAKLKLLHNLLFEIDLNKLGLMCLSDVAQRTMKNINKSFPSNFIEPDSYSKLKFHTSNLISSISCRLPIDTVKDICDTCFKLLVFSNLNITAIDEMYSFLVNDVNAPFKSIPVPETLPSKKDNLENLLQKKIEDLKKLLDEKSISFLNSRTSMTTAMEMLTLEILILLDEQRNLVNNFLFLDQIAPTLVGKALRNHLAHDNAISDILDINPSIVIYCNARKLTFLKTNALKNVYIGLQPNDNSQVLFDQINKHSTIIEQLLSLYTALENGSISDVENILTSGGDLQSVTLLDKNSSLHFTIRSGNEDLLKLVSSQIYNVDWNIKNIRKENLLHTALEFHGNPKIVQYLIDKQVEIECYNEYNKLPLEIACTLGHLDAIKLMIDKSPNLKKISSPFIGYAAVNNHAEVVRFLLKIYPCLKADVLLAIKGGNVDIIKDILDYSVIDVCNEGGYDSIPLHTTVEYGKLDVLKLLCEYGANLNAVNALGVSLVHMAIQCHQFEILEYLMTSGISPNIVDVPYLNTPLHNAVREGQIDMVNCLLKHNAAVSPLTYEQMTPLHWAIHEGFADIAKLLISAGAKIDCRNLRQEFPLHLACRNGNFECVKLLLKEHKNHNISIDAKNTGGGTPLLIACLFGKYSIAKYLIEMGADITTQDCTKQKLLHAAATSGVINIAELLLDHGIDVDSKNKYEFTPLHFACIYKQEKMISFLIQRGANINIQNLLQQLPIHVVLEEKYSKLPTENLFEIKIASNDTIVINILQLLIKNDSLLNVQDSFGNTALHCAIKTFPNAAFVLIENGCDASIQNLKKQSALLYASEYNNTGIVTSILKEGNYSKTDIYPAIVNSIKTGNRDMFKVLYEKYDGKQHHHLLEMCVKFGNAIIGNFLIQKVGNHLINNSIVQIAVAGGHINIMKMLINNGLDVDALFDPYTNGTVLHAAVHDKNEELVKLLFDNNVNVNIRDLEGRSAFEFAVGKGNLNIVKIFDLNKIDINQEGTDGFTPLHIAAQENCYDVVKYLLSKGANVHARNHNKAMPVHIAAREGNLAIVELFFKHNQSLDDLGKDNQSLLHYAALKETSINVLNYLIDKGICLDKEDKYGATALNCSCLLGNNKTVLKLLQNGARVDFTHRLIKVIMNMPRDCNPREYFLQQLIISNSFVYAASSRKYENITKILTDLKTFFTAVKKNCIDTVKECILQKCPINAKCGNYFTVLHIAAWKGFTNILTLLLQNSADPNFKNISLATPLHYAAKYSNLDCVLELLKHGAIYEARYKNKTPFDYATDNEIKKVLIMVHDCFLAIQNGNNINFLLKSLKSNQIPAVMRAKNLQNRTIVVEAMLNQYQHLFELQCLQQNIIELQMIQSFFERNLYDKAFKLLKTIVNHRRKIFGKNSPATLIIERSITIILEKKGEYFEALKKYKYIEQELIKVLGKDHAEVLETSVQIASVKQKLGENKEALNIFRNVLKKYMELYGVNDERTEVVQINMGLALCELNFLDEALSIYENYYNKLKEVNSKKHPRIIKCLHNIAMVLTKMKKFDEALKMFEEVYELKKVVFGINDKDTMRTLRNISSLYKEQKLYNKYMDMQIELLSRQKEWFGDLDPETVLTNFDIGYTYFQMGNFMNSYCILKPCLGKIKKAYGTKNEYFKVCNDTIKQISKLINWKSDTYELLELYMCSEIKQNIHKANYKAIYDLLQMGVDFNKKDNLGFAPVHYVVNSDNIKMMRIMLSTCFQIDISALTMKNNTVLHIACTRGNLEMIKFILQSTPVEKIKTFIDIETSNKHQTALNIAANKKRFDIVFLLIRFGAKYNVKINTILN